MPPHVEYMLTEYGQTASVKLADLVGWLEENLSGILASQPSSA
ncbi:winged helix-turn-helix transcriptional regulator [uncultured Moraxella sp.]|nr:winged helix-turn-helix transcriptional regulator [uncultured Moraxella sp.]